MSYQEKKTIVSMFTGVLVLAAYCIYAFGRYQAGTAGADNLKVWAGIMLIFIGIGIVTAIVIQIVFHILMSIGIAVEKKIRDENYDDKEIEKSIEIEMVEDEMDKLIELKSMRTGFIVAGAGFIAGLAALVLGSSSMVMLNILFISFSAGSILEGITQLYFYRRGVVNG